MDPNASRATAARKPTARAWFGDYAKHAGVAVPVQVVTLSHSINQLPTAEFTVALDSAPSDSGVICIDGVQINIGKMNQLGKLLQEKVYNSFSLQPDVTIELWDGDGEYNADYDAWGNHIVYQGFMCSPSFEVSNGTFLMKFCVLHSMARLQAFNPAIYGASSMYSTTGDVHADVMSTVYGDLKRDDSITSRVYLLLQALLNWYVQEYAAELDPSKMQVLQSWKLATSPVYEPAQWNIHLLNTQLMDTIKQVCERSRIWTEIAGLVNPDGTPNNNFHESPLHRTIFDILFNSPSFLDALNNLRGPFLFQMNAHWDDALWLEHIQTLEVPRSMIVTPVGALSFNLTSGFEVPLLQVIARGYSSDFYTLSPTVTSAAPPSMIPVVQLPTLADAQAVRAQAYRLQVHYPSQVPTINGQTMPGRFLYVTAPYWLGVDYNQQLAAVNKEYKTTPLAEASKSPPAVNITATPNASDPRLLRVDNQQNMLLDKANRDIVRSNFLYYIAKYTFKDMCLERTSARISIPLNVLPQVGRTYFLCESGQNASIHMGYLANVTHVMGINGDHGIAETQLYFTHIVSRDAQLLPLLLGGSEAIDPNDKLAYTKKNIDDNEKALLAQIGKTQRVFVAPASFVQKTTKAAPAAAPAPDTVITPAPPASNTTPDTSDVKPAATTAVTAPTMPASPDAVITDQARVDGLHKLYPGQLPDKPTEADVQAVIATNRAQYEVDKANSDAAYLASKPKRSLFGF